MEFELLRVFIAVAGVGIAAVEDWKTSYIDDKTTLALMGAGVLLNFLEAWLHGFNSLFGVFGVGLLIAGIGFIAYKTGQLGGGDVLLFLGIHFLLPVTPSVFLLESAQKTFYPFFLSVLVAASFLAAFGSALWYAKRLNDCKRLLGKKLFFVAGMIVLSAFASFFLFPSLFQKIFFTSLVACIVFLTLFKKDIEEFVLVKWLSLKEAEDEDVIAVRELREDVVREYGIGKVLTASEKKKLKRVSREKKLRKFPFFKELPRFGPYVFLGLIACLLVGDVVLFVLLD